MILTLVLSLTTMGAPARSIAQDTLPPLHTLPDKDIDSVTYNDRDEAISVFLTNGQIYLYRHEIWEMEDHYPGISERVKKAIDRSFPKTFTKCEKMPEFPGGDEAWQKYIDSFCVVHKKDVRKAGAIEVMVQCIVHLRGQLTDIQLITTADNKKQEELAIRAVKESPPWTPAYQNGRTWFVTKKYMSGSTDERQRKPTSPPATGTSHSPSSTHTPTKTLYYPASSRN